MKKPTKVTRISGINVDSKMVFIETLTLPKENILIP